MKKEVTEYEGAEDTVTRIKCDSCDEMWESRDSDDLNLVALDVSVERYSVSSWRDVGKGEYHGRDKHRMTAEATADFCDSCLDQNIPVGTFMEVEEPEYYVEEQKRVEYYCDFCEKSMGDTVEHEVTVNPHITREPSGFGHHSGDPSVAVDELGASFYGGGISESHHFEHDGEFECCESCASDIFGGESDDSVPVVSDVTHAMESLFTGFKSVLFGV